MTLKFHNMIAPVALGLAIALTASVADAGKGKGGGTTSSDPTEVKVECRKDVRTLDVKMDSRYESKDGRQRFSASFEIRAFDGAPSSVPVTVDGVDVGDMNLVLAGVDLQGDLEFDTQSTAGDFAQPFPDDFPAVASGTEVVVDGLYDCTLN